MVSTHRTLDGNTRLCTTTAEQADVHLPIRAGTNVALLLHALISRDWVDHDWVQQHAVGYDDLADVVSGYSPQRAAETCAVDPAAIEEAARIIGTGQWLVSTDEWPADSGKHSGNWRRRVAAGISELAK